MSIINVDTSNPKLTEKRSFDPVPKAVYPMEIANALVTETSKSTPDNMVVPVELVVVDDGEFKGRKVFDNLVICGPNAEAKSKSGCDQKIAAFAMCFGVLTKEQVEVGEGIDLDLFKGCTGMVDVITKVNVYEGVTSQKNVVRAYLFDDGSEAS